LELVCPFCNLGFSRCIINLKFKTMSSYRQHLYHIIFRTKDSKPTIKQNHVGQLYAYITGIIKNKDSHLYRINGIENHLHILTDMHPSIAPADFVRELLPVTFIFSSFRAVLRWVSVYPRLHRGLFTFGSCRADYGNLLFICTTTDSNKMN
jgi:REP element-mobilizing transposase RayT